jgi:peptidoglycan/xylan/chitin deacetylase (PgdA/CDA1 family)
MVFNATFKNIMVISWRFNCPIDHFCYPYGDYNDEIVNMVAKAGYKTATTVRKGRANINRRK